MHKCPMQTPCTHSQCKDHTNTNNAPAVCEQINISLQGKSNRTNQYLTCTNMWFKSELKLY